MQAHEDRNIMIAVCVQASLHVIGFILSCFTDAGTEATERYKVGGDVRSSDMYHTL